jgi:hypothetical protein
MPPRCCDWRIARKRPIESSLLFWEDRGIEVSVALKLRRRDIDPTSGEIRAAGTTTLARDRIVRVAEWAGSFVEDHQRDLRANDLHFPAIDRWKVSQAHREACERPGDRG